MLKDRDALIAALRACGYDPVIHDTAHPLIGYQGDRRPETAEVIVPRSQLFAMANDLGFKRQADGTYSAVLFDYRHLEQRDILRKISQQYGLIKATAALRAKGYTIGTPAVQADGSLRLVAQRW